MLPTAINLYSVRALDEPLPDTIDRVADAGYDGVQFSGGLDGHDPESLLRAYGDRLSLIHMKDMHTDEGAFAEIGEGDVDMQACAEAASDVDADWLIYEHDDPENPVESIEQGAAFLDSF